METSGSSDGGFGAAADSDGGSRDSACSNSVPTLTFEGTTAKCEVFVVGNTADETLFATVKLMHGDEMLRTWYPSARGILDFEESVNVTRGETYTLTVRVYTATATNLPEMSVSGKCE